MTAISNRGGFAAAAAAYFIWGLFPLYWRLLASVPSAQLLAHRVAWCAVVVWLFLLLRGEGAWWRGITPRVWGMLAGSAVFISFNWGVYIVGINSGHVLDTSLGYFITPLVNVLCGVVMLRERLNVLQWAAVSCAAIGVGWMAWQLGTLPWIALVLAFSFAAYGLIRKLTPVDAVQGLAVESLVLLPLAVGFLLWRESAGDGVFLHEATHLDVLMVAGGAITALPLVLFAYGARRVPMTLLGFLQYLAPIAGIVIAVFVFHEPFGSVQRVAFSWIWLALALFSTDAVRRYLAQRELAR
jgi:chloramphenicol-sensitive protein RarD